MSHSYRLFLILGLVTLLGASESSEAQQALPQQTQSQQGHPEQDEPQPLRIRRHGPGMTDATTFAVTAESGVPEIPFRLINNHLILQIRVNDTVTVDAVLDTGMPQPGLALHDTPKTRGLELAFDPNIKAQVAGAGGGPPMTARIAIGVSLDLEGLTIGGARIIALPAMTDFGGYHDAIIGYSFFSRFVVELDYDRSLMRLYDPASYEAPPDAFILPLTLRHRIPFANVRVTPHRGEPFGADVAVDLGASHAISLNTAASAQIKVPDKSLRAVLGHGLSGPVEGEVGRLAALELGGARLTDVVASFPVDEHQHPRGMDSRAGNLGSDVLRRFKTTFDYSRERMILVPNESFAEPFEFNWSGLKLGAGRKLEILSVIPGSPAAESGVLIGDVVTHVDGKAVTAADYGAVRDALIGPGEVTLRLARGEETLERKVVLRRLI